MSAEKVRLAAKILAAAGVCVSSWLLYHHVYVRSFPHGAPSFCSINEFINCDAVALSRFSEVLGIPLASYGIVYYLAILLVVSPAGGKEPADWLRALAALSFFGAGVGLAELSISLFAVNALCFMCALLYLINFALFGFAASAAGGVAAGLAPGSWLSLTALLRDKLARTGVHILVTLLALGGVLLLPMLMQRAAVALNPPQPFDGTDTEVVEQWRRGRIQKLTLQLGGPLEERDFSRGPADAKTVVVVYSDFECPHCHHAAQLFEQLAKEFSFRFIFKNFPLGASCNRLMKNDLHPMACLAATLARCAGTFGEEQFWNFHDLVVVTPEPTGEQLKGYINDLGLPADQIDRCLDDPRTADRIKRDVEEGIELKIAGTPAIYINGKQVLSLSEGAIRGILAEANR